ncbi:MAG: DUF2339 domain-containing protein [Burkholderiales bacterium]|nr:DUF2339 domain-containing protein [Burkholderiales bacterium]
MKAFLAALGTFIAGIVMNVPTFVVVVLTAIVWLAVHAVTTSSEKSGESDTAVGTSDPELSSVTNDLSLVRERLANLIVRLAIVEQQVIHLARLVEGPPPPPKPGPPVPESLHSSDSAAPATPAASPIETAPAVAATPRNATPPNEPEAERGVKLDWKEDIAEVPAKEEPATEVPPRTIVQGSCPESAASSPVQPFMPSFLERLVSGNIVAKVGAVVLFFGVGFLLKYAYDRSLFPPAARLGAVALGAAVVFACGWRMRDRRPLYAIILQGVASGLAYLDVFFALKVFSFIATPVGFGLFTLLGVATTLLAVRQDAMPLAVLGLTGAFLAPVLASTDSGSHVLLFSYYLLLNIFIVAVSWFKSWRPLSLTGWFFTLAVAAFWGSRSYTPALFGTVEPFLLAFFAIYLVLPILFATRQPPELKGVVDGTLVFGTPAAVAFIQARLVWDMPYGLAWSSALGAALYALLAFMVARHNHMRLLRDTYIALFLGLGTLAIAFAFDAYATFALWTIEGTAILWVCLRQNSFPGRVFALAVQIGGAVFFLHDYDRYVRFNPWFNDAVLGCAIIAVAFLMSSMLYRRHGDLVGQGERSLGTLLLYGGALAYAVGGLDVVYHGVDAQLQPMVLVLFFSLSTFGIELAATRLRWTALRALTVPHLILLAVAVAFQVSLGGHPFANLGWLAWPVSLGTAFWYLHRQRRDGFGAALEIRYAGAWVIFFFIATWEAGWRLNQREYLLCMVVAAIGYVAAAIRFRLRESNSQAPRLSTLVLIWAMFFWFVSGFAWIERDLAREFEVRAGVALITLSAVTYHLVARRLGWEAMNHAARLPWLAFPLVVLMDITGTGLQLHPLGGVMAWTWPLSLGLAAWMLYREERGGLLAWTGYRHLVLLYLPVVLFSWELLSWVRDLHLGTAWQMAATAVPAALILLIGLSARNIDRWPLREHRLLYLTLLTPVALGLLLWSFVANVRAPGELEPLRYYVPFLNPLDMAIAIAACAAVVWSRCLGETDARNARTAIAVLGFVWLNAMVLRSVHYWESVPYQFDYLVRSVTVQAALSILWTAIAFGLMLRARYRTDRGLWIVGAGLLTVVVGKLFLVDLAIAGTVSRIVSFLAVGIMLLAIGYFVPVPPGKEDTTGEAPSHG